MIWFMDLAASSRAAYLALAALLVTPALADATEKPQLTLITNVNIFDGKNDTLAMDKDVLVEGNLIKTIGKGLKANNNATVIDGGGRTLMPGLIDGHAHVVPSMPTIRSIESDMNCRIWPSTRVRATGSASRWMDLHPCAMWGDQFSHQARHQLRPYSWPEALSFRCLCLTDIGAGHFRDRADAGYTAPRLAINQHSRLNIGKWPMAFRGPRAVRAQFPAWREPDQNHAAGGGGFSRFDPVDGTVLQSGMSAAVEAAKDWGSYVGAILQ